MSNAVFLNVYKLKKGASISAFKEAVNALHDGYISKLKGYVTFELMMDEAKGVWSDRTVFETMADAKAFATACDPNPLAETFYEFLNLSTCRSHLFAIANYSI